MARYNVFDVSFVCLFVSILLLFSLPGAALFYLGWNYQTLGGSLWEKIHPSTMLLFAGLFFNLLNKRRLVSCSPDLQRRVFYYFVSLMVLVVYVAFILNKSIAVFFDTWMAAGVYVFLWSYLSPPQLYVLRSTVLVLVILNLALGIAEFTLGFRLIPLVLVDIEDLGSILDVSEWSESRSSALLNHPLTASLISSICFFIALALMIFDKPTKARFLFLPFCFVAMAAFGGRASMAITLLLSVLLLIVSLLSRKTVKLKNSGFIVLISLLSFIPVLVGLAWFTGVLDPLMARVNDDNGSAESRLIVFEILAETSWVELFLGDIYGALIGRIIGYGALYGLEISWLNIALNYGFLGFVFLFYQVFKLFRDFAFGRWIFNPWWVFLQFFLICSTAVYFSSKTLVVTQMVVLVSLFVVSNVRLSAFKGK